MDTSPNPLSEADQRNILLVAYNQELQVRLRAISLAHLANGHFVATANGAMMALATRTFDLCFLDLDRPGGHGDEVSAVARMEQPLLPVVAMTYLEDSPTLDQILQFGPVLVLWKPVRTYRLVEILFLDTPRNRFMRIDYPGFFLRLKERGCPKGEILQKLASWRLSDEVRCEWRGYIEKFWGRGGDEGTVGAGVTAPLQPPVPPLFRSEAKDLPPRE